MVKLCSNLSYERSLSPGKAVFFHKTSKSNFEPLEIESCYIRGIKGSFHEAYTSNGKLKASLALSKLGFGNPIHIESCFVPPNVDYLYCRFSLRVKASSMQPLVCSDSDLKTHLMELAEQYRDMGGFDELAKRYCINILDGSWLWRNQHARELEIVVRVAGYDEELLVSNLHRCGKDPLFWDVHSRGVLDKAASGMSRALHDPQAFWFADITAMLRVEFCQEVFPSQMFVDKEGGKIFPKKQLVKTRTSDGREAACLTSTKVGSAIQMVDDWWEEGAEKSLRVSEYGADASTLLARRGPLSGRDFYSILANSEILLKSEADRGGVSPEYHYLMAVLVKGGMFQKGR